MSYRNRRLLDLAHRLNECTAQIEGVCEGYSNHGLEPAHSNQQRHGKGMGNKADDVFHAAMCHSCHAEIDQGKMLSKDERRDVWQRAHERTLLEYFKRGWLRVDFL